MTDLRELAHRLVSDEVLEGKDAQTIMGVATEAAPWQLWVQVALAYLDLDQPDYARSILEQLLEEGQPCILNRPGGKSSG